MIHPAVGDQWKIKIPILLMTIEGNKQGRSTVISAEQKGRGKVAASWSPPLNYMKEEPMDSLASPVCLRAMLAIKHLSKVKPSLNLDENINNLDDCLKCLLSLPAVQQLRKEDEMSQDSFQIQSMTMDSAEKELRGLHKEPKASIPEAVLIASSHMVKVIGKYFPSSQAL
ncbi:hypothetical protein Y1Q_0006559 [Alligator mississippiensis]|uniref:MROH2B-like HEAT-repeats domain-containing protein n=1 Tax=Alligator mississippiensis TaxID=8496 RepID=A0A151NTE0_ALLMI|nr:hypothetical protein Y1Q_0006559 [Alligator mississippiensis]